MRGASVLTPVQCAGVLLLLLLPRALAHTSRPSSEQQKLKPVPPSAWVSRRHDIIVQSICDAKCWKFLNLKQCMKSCFTKHWEMPGACPKLIQINDNSNSSSPPPPPSPFYQPCLNECKKDSDCTGIRKCCKHQCGSTCQPAQNLHNNSALLPIPHEIHIKPRKKKALHIKWKPATHLSNQAIFYILEQRQQFGQFDAERADLGEWSTCLRTGKASVLLRNFVRPGRWYQFRIASVNENGTRGFSQPVTYIAQIGPRPPKAPEVTVGPVYMQNDTLHTELQWHRPQSEAPILKFKVFWSKRLFGMSELDSVLVLQHSLPADTTNYTIRDLAPNSMYFIQVQAIAQSGKEVLRGEKSGYVLNTINYTQITPSDQTTANVAICKIDNLQLDKLYWSKDENDLKARFTWKPDAPNIRYNITWWGSCKNNKTPQHKLTATTRNSHFDVYDLHFDCRYKVNVKETHHTRRKRMHGEKHLPKRAFYETSVTFSTPSCKSLQARYKRLKCKLQP